MRDNGCDVCGENARDDDEVAEVYVVGKEDEGSLVVHASCMTGDMEVA